MNKKRIFALAILLIFTGFLLSFVFSNHLIASASIAVSVFMLIFSALFRSDKEKKEINKIKKLPFSTIAQLVHLNDQTRIKVKGRLEAIEYTISELSETKCIGYMYQEMKWTYTKRTGERSKKSQWKIIKSESYTEDFYLVDNSGKIKVDTVDISIHTSFNQKKEKRGNVSYIEYLLLPDQKEYILVGTLQKRNGKISISKDFKDHTENDDFILIDPKSYDIFYHTSTAYRIGCAAFLLLIFLAIIVFLFQDLWIYLVDFFKQ